MTQSITCKKVTSLLALYIDNKLDPRMQLFVKQHLEICPYCHKKYIMLKQLISELRNAYKDMIQDTAAEEKHRQFNIKEYEKFHTNLSAYFDNELPLNESVSMKKYMIKFPNARKDLEEMYNLHKIINTSLLCVKKTLNEDYSKTICYRVLGKNPDFKKQITLKIASFVGIIIMLATLITANIPIGKTVKEKSIKLFKKTIYVHSPINHELASDLMQ